MKHLKLFATLLLAIGGGNALAQTDVTAQYLQNPSFELSAENTKLTSVQKESNAILNMYGWTETGVSNQFNNSEIINASTDNSSAFGKRVNPSDGDYYFFARQGWNSGANNHIILTSNEFNLPSGRYELSINYKQAHSWDNSHKNSFDTKVSIAFKSNNSEVSSSTSGAAPASPGANYFNTSDWQILKTSFTINETTIGNVVVDFAAGGGVRSDFVIDNVRLVGVDLAYYKNQFETKKTEAESLLNDETYKIVVGEERTKMKNIADGTYTTIDEYENATESLNTAISTFKSTLTNYANLETAKTSTEVQLPYASAAKFTALTTAKNCEAAASASDADAKVNAIAAARRAYVESNGKAEGVAGAVDCTDKLPITKAGTDMPSGTYSQVRINNGDGATDSEGNKTATYFDSADAFWKSNNLTATLSQKATELKAGKYLLTVQARGSSNLKELVLTAGNDTKTLNVQNSANVFGSGWDDYSLETIVDNSGSLSIKIEGVTNAKQAWFSFNDFRLVRIGDLDGVTLDEATNNTIEAGVAKVTLKRTLVADKWNTLVLPFDVADADAKNLFGDDVKIAKYSNSDDVNIKFNTDEEGIKANVPVLIMPTKVAEDKTYTFDGATLVSATPTAEGSAFDFVGSYNGYQLANDEYMLYGDKWWKTEEGDTYKIKAFRAYIKAKTAQAAKSMNLVIDGQTTGLKLNTTTGSVEGETYNLAGQRVANSYKGIVVKNGKKMIKK